MDQTNAQVGQEEAPEGKISENNTEERPTTSTGSMETLLQEEGLNLDFPKQGEIPPGVIASLGENEWLEAKTMKASGTAVDAQVIGYNKGGLIVPIGMLRGFVPASQVSVMRRAEGDELPDTRWSKMVGEPIKVVVIEVDRTRNSLILSERSALQETRETIKDRLLDELQEGVIKTGRVTSLADFGAFVNIDGADGLVHLSEISWERIAHPNEILKVGQEVQVKVISVDKDRKRIGIST